MTDREGGVSTVLLEAAAAAAILAAAEPARPLRVSLDLHLSETTVEFERGAFVAAGHAFGLAPLIEIAAAPRQVFRPVAPPAEGPVAEWEPVRVFDGSHYQLVPTSEAPTLEIDGIQMHITSGAGPFAATGEFAAAAVQAGDRVLDTCGGLGYTALQAIRRGARGVVSFELSPGVLEIRAANPWSRPTDDEQHRLRLERADVLRGLAGIPAGSVDSVIHDPPRHNLAPELYTEAFYLRLREAMRPGGRLFHYTGAPGRAARGDAFVRRVTAALRRVGFRPRPRPELQGIVAQKP